MDKELIRQVVREELAFMIKNKKLVFPFPIQIMDGNDIQLGKTNGTRIGTEGYSASSGGQKLGFFGKTPIVQFPTGYLIQPTGGATVDNEARGRINDINYLLAQFGFAYDVT